MEMSIVFKSDDGTLPDDHVMSVWSKKFLEAGEKWGKTFKIAEKSRNYIAEAGFEEVTEKKYKLPVRGWARDPKLKQIGTWNFIHCDQALEGWAMVLLTTVMGVSTPQSHG